MIKMKHLLCRMPLLFILGLANFANADEAFPPLVNGSNSAQFKLHDLIMASASQKSVTLNYGPFHLHSLSTDNLARIASPLIDKVMGSGRVTTASFTSSGNSTKQDQVANAVFFLVSIHPDVLLAIPDSSEDVNTQQGNLQNTVINFMKQTGTVVISNMVTNRECTSSEYNTGSENCKFMGQRQLIVNQVIVSRLFLKRKGTLIVSDQTKTPIALGDNFETGGIKFEFAPVVGMNGFLEARIIHK